MFPAMSTTGVVTSAMDKEAIRVLPDGRKTSQRWYRSFWKKRCAATEDKMTDSL